MFCIGAIVRDAMDDSLTKAATPIESVADLPPLVATSVVRGSEQGQSHGGLYLIDPSSQSVFQVLDWNTIDIDWEGRGWDRGLRGIAFHGDCVYIAASDELFIYDRHFRERRSYRNPYLKHCHEIVVYRGVLHLTSTGYDSILGFDLETETFSWGMYLSKQDGKWQGHRFDPNSDIGPPNTNKFHINSVFCREQELGLSGLRTDGVVSLRADGMLYQSVELPPGTHNAQLFGDGVIFNDTRADFVRYVTRDGKEQRFPFPVYDPKDIEYAGVDDTNVARQGFGRGLCVIEDRFLAVGSSPSTVSVFDLASGSSVFSVNFSMDIRNAIHGLEVWPYPLPDGIEPS